VLGVVVLHDVLRGSIAALRAPYVLPKQALFQRALRESRTTTPWRSVGCIARFLSVEGAGG
jgi:hypothetical protein